MTPIISSTDCFTFVDATLQTSCHNFHTGLVRPLSLG